MKVVRPESDHRVDRTTERHIRDRDEIVEWHDYHKTSVLRETAPNSVTEDGMSYFWKVFLITEILIAASVVLAFVALADPVQFRTDQYVPPVVQAPLLSTGQAYIPPQIIQPLTIQSGCSK